MDNIYSIYTSILSIREEVYKPITVIVDNECNREEVRREYKRMYKGHILYFYRPIDISMLVDSEPIIIVNKEQELGIFIKTPIDSFNYITLKQLIQYR